MAKIILENNIVVKTEGLPNPIPSIGKWMEVKSMTLWTKVFSSHIKKGGSYSKSQEFMAQDNCEKIVKRVVMRYFWRVLVAKGALAATDLPLCFSKWTDTFTSDCVFIDAQKRGFCHHHLLQCPWYLEMRESIPTLGDEVEFYAACDALTLTSGGGAVALPSIVSEAITDNPELSEKAKAKAIEKATKAKMKEQERETARLQREISKKEKKETKETYKEFTALVTKEGPQRLFTQLGGAVAFADPPMGGPS